MRLSEVIHGIQITDRRGRMDADITGVTSDSRRVRPGDLFVAVRGLSADGHNFVLDALERGATAVLAEHWQLKREPERRPQVVLVPNSRRALALAAANLYGQPSRKLLVAGVTGTNGKTTVTYLLESIMRAASRNVGVVGTVECRFGGRIVRTEHTTPDAVELHKLLAQMRGADVSHVAMEVSSHALDQQRVAGVHFKVAGFTNLTQDHLDYHKTLETYFKAKARLFSEVLRKSRARGRMAVVNVDDPRGEALVELWGGKSLRVSMDPERSEADVVALSTRLSLDGTELEVRTPKGVFALETKLIGEHNVSNALVAIGMALAMGFSKSRIVRGLAALERVPGRLDRVPNDDGLRILVDYAHTPDALDRVLATLRPLVKGRVIVVFGCGGDRDREKRPLMGAAVGKHAQLAVVTNDNPRSESPDAIAAAIRVGLEQAGMKEIGEAAVDGGFRVILDRRDAIRQALDWATPDDVVLIAGKGHEAYQIVGKEHRPFDDYEEARRMLAGLPPPLPEPTSDSLRPVQAPVPDVSVRGPSPRGESMTVEVSASDIELISSEDAVELGLSADATAEIDAIDIESVRPNAAVDPALVPARRGPTVSDLVPAPPAAAAADAVEAESLDEAEAVEAEAEAVEAEAEAVEAEGPAGDAASAPEVPTPDAEAAAPDAGPTATPEAQVAGESEPEAADPAPSPEPSAAAPADAPSSSERPTALPRNATLSGDWGAAVDAARADGPPEDPKK